MEIKRIVDMIRKFTIGTGQVQSQSVERGVRPNLETYHRFYYATYPSMKTNGRIMVPEELVLNAEKLISIYGRWPSFHDAEVLSLSLERAGPCCVIRLASHERTRDVDDQGFYKKENQCLITIRFTEVEDLCVEDFNHQNVIAGIVLEQEEKMRVKIEGIFGMSAEFRCAGIVIEEAVRLDNNGN